MERMPSMSWLRARGWQALQSVQWRGLDLREAIRQNLLLALPMKALCRENCAGLCSQCGKDLNEGSCDCVFEVEDDRFKSLRQLLEETAEG